MNENIESKNSIENDIITNNDIEDDNKSRNNNNNLNNNNNIFSDNSSNSNNHFNVNNINNENESDYNSDEEDIEQDIQSDLPKLYTTPNHNNYNNEKLFNLFKKSGNEEEESDDESEFGKHSEDEFNINVPELIDYSESIVNILIPVSITMLITILILRLIADKSSAFMQFSPLLQYNLNDDDASQTLIFNPVINSVIFLAVIVLSTFIMVILYKFKFMKALYGWLIGTSILLLGVFGGFLFILVLIYANLPLDYISFILVIWNFSAGGMICIYYYAPKLLNRAYLISVAVLMALFFTRLPEWTTWGILAIVSIYDIFAVLCPGGPLKQLIDTAKARGEEIPALIYNGSVYFGMAFIESNNSSQPSPSNFSKSDSTSSLEDDGKKSISSSPSSSDIDTSNSDTSIQVNETKDDSSESSEETKSSGGIKLGLGDFVFYSVLVGRAALYDMITVCTCFIAIITGLFLTLLGLAIYKKALPALPMSIALGILFYFTTKIILTPYLLFIGVNQIFI